MERGLVGCPGDNALTIVDKNRKTDIRERMSESVGVTDAQVPFTG